MNHLATTAFLHPPLVSPPSPNTSITLQSPHRYKKLSKAWKESKPPSKTPEEASRLVIRTLQRYQTPDLDGFLSLYHLPHWLVELTAGEAPALADGLKFQLHTLPVDAKAVADGDTVTVYVSTSDSRESSRVSNEVRMAVVEWNEACAERNYTKADALHKQITDAGYRVLHIDNQEILARKYRIRLSGRKMLELRELDCGLHQILKCHGNGGKIVVKTDIDMCIPSWQSGSAWRPQG